MICAVTHDFLQGQFILKAFHWGQRGAKENYASQLRNIVEKSYKSLGETPTIIGECGVPMDLKWVTIIIRRFFFLK